MPRMENEITSRELTDLQRDKLMQWLSNREKQGFRPLLLKLYTTQYNTYRAAVTLNDVPIRIWWNGTNWRRG